MFVMNSKQLGQPSGCRHARIERRDEEVEETVITDTWRAQGESGRLCTEVSAPLAPAAELFLLEPWRGRAAPACPKACRILSSFVEFWTLLQ